MTPLAERIRPTTLDELAGQQHLTGKGSILRTAIEHGRIPSMILWGPPGTGKTTIANIIANTLNVPFFTLSAISAGVKDVREVIEQAKTKPESILFIDEIHRFNKGQQDALLGAVEKCIITLIGATTENPSFEVNSALLSRCQVYVLKTLDEKDLVHLLHTALEKDEILKKKKIELKENGISTLMPRKVWFDDTVKRLNVDARGELLGEFKPSDKIMIINQSGKLKVILPELSTHFD